MKAVAVICIGLVLGVQGDAGLEARCKKLTVDFKACARKAHTDYAAAMAVGDDGREAFTARKSCNFVTEAVDVCSNKLIGECNTEAKVIRMKDEQIMMIVKRLEDSIAQWESDKCPAVKASFERLKAAEEPTAQAQNPAPEGEPEPETNPEPEPEGEPSVNPTGASSSLAISGLLLIGGLLVV